MEQGEIIGELRVARRVRGMSQGELGDALGVSLGSIQSWETGRRTPGLGVLRRWAGYFGLELVVSRKCSECGRMP